MNQRTIFVGASLLVLWAGCGGNGSQGFSGDDGGTGSFVGDDGGNRSDPCVAAGKPSTTVSGIVYDPAGKVPLYDIYVYVPSKPLDPIMPGNAKCTPCEAYASGDPLTGTLTDDKGHFVLTNVPSGDNVPLVMQVGKWRREIKIPHVSACTDNPQSDPTVMRLPSKSSEGDMPLIAFTSGCDLAECFLRHIGIDDSEFVATGSPNGHIHFMQGYDGFDGNVGWASLPGGYTFTQTYQWWNSAQNLLKYDIVFNACECEPYDRNTMVDTGGGGSPSTAGAYDAMKAFLDGGGRLFATHYYWNWFTQEAEFKSVANWDFQQGNTPDTDAPYFVDMTFPKGVSFGNWLLNLGVGMPVGSTAAQIPIVDTFISLDAVTPAATRWIYGAPMAGASPYHAKYITFNAPTAASSDKQCGRAVFSDVHVSGGPYAGQGGSGRTFPDECASLDTSHLNNEKALEFLFFDLSSCVQNDTRPPQAPVQ